MTIPFREYAQCYALLYRDKDYAGEARFVARLLERYVGKPVEQTEILDLACGAGRHAQELAGMGYRVEGSDLSADMLKVASDLATSLKRPIRLYNESFQTCDRIGRKYDAVVAMFAAIDYLTDYKDIARSLKNIRGLLREGGVFLFDFWNGNAVLPGYSPTRVKRVEEGDETVIRVSNTSLDPVRQIATVHFDFLLLKAGSVLREFSEDHLVRYFFPQEMMDVLSANGFEVIHRCPFLKEDGGIEPEEWNLTYVARPCE